MGDRLTQLQESLDQLVTQFFSSLNYINVHHTPRRPAGLPPHVPIMEPPAEGAEEQLSQNLRELSKDIVAKSKQIIELINSLPDLENMQADIPGLERSLEEARKEHAAASAERAELLERCDRLVLAIAEYKSSVERAGEVQ